MLHALLLLAGACGAGAQPSSVISRYGMSVSVVCQRGPPLERCRVDGASPSASASRRTWSLKEGVKPGAGDGDGWDQCGFSIQKKAANEARGFRCLLRLQQQQQNGSKMADVFKIIVQKSSNDSRVYVSSTGQLTTNGVNDRFPNDEEFVLHDNDTLTATCAVPEFPLPSDMSWNLVDQNLTHDLTNRQTKHLHRRDLSVNQMKSSFRVKCRRKSKMFSCDVIFQSEVSENMETTPPMQVECEYAEDMVLPPPAIVVSPPIIVAREGDRVTVVCHAESALKFCRIEKLAPNMEQSRRRWNLNENIPPSEDGMEYAGSGLSKGDCGFTMERVTVAFNAQFRCVVGFSNRPDEGTVVFNISVTGKLEDVVLPQPGIHVPPLTIAREGDDVTVVCVADRALNYCRIEKLASTVGQSDHAWDLQENVPASQDGVVYAGRGLAKGECGFTMRHVTHTFNGQFRCLVGFFNRPEERVAIFNISIVVAPSAPDLKVSPFGPQSTGDFVFREGDLLTASCAIRDSRPPANISWYLDSYKLTGGISSREIIHQTDKDLFTVQQNISLPVSCENSGKIIKCVAEHIALEFNIQTEARVNVACDMAMIVTPAVTVAREGSRVTVLCRAEGALQYCRIEKLAPNMEHSQLWWYLNENMPTSRDGVAYAGSGLSEGYCGFTVHRVTQAFNGQFRCVAGFGNRSDEGVGTFNISVLDCGGGPDDIKNGCGSFTCPSNAFQCANGVCIDKNGLCNGIKQCADGSDETTERCGMNTTTPKPTTQPMPSASCKLPPQPENGQYKFRGCDPPCQHPGQIVNNAYLIYICNPGFVLSGSRAVYCDGGWSAAFPTCSRTCAPLQFPSRDIECKLNDYKVECNQPMASGTRVRVKCKEFFTNPKEFDDFVTTCESNGEWSRQVFSCTPKCGEPNPNGVPFVAGGPEAKNGEFPWHAGIYKKFEGRYQQVCGGNIITERTIVTVAHCFWDIPLQVQIGSQEYRVAVGKFYREWYHPNDTRFQSPEIDRVVLPDRFRGSLRYYADDIAVVKLKNIIVMTVGIAPICVDYAKKFENVFFSGTTGIVMGWGYTENQNPSDTLRKATLPYVAFQTCEKKVPLSFVPYLTYDKFCAGYDNGTSVCGGDSGGGYAVQFGDGKYYLMGLVSVGVPGTNMECNHFQYTTFTKVFEFYDFIQDNML